VRTFSFLILWLVASTGTLLSQACFRIESILVDACGTPEGENEMVRIRIGPNALNTNQLQITWPNNNNPYLGICQSPQTALKVAAMNAQIQACGYFLEPTNGVLPADANVLIITSANYDQTAHDYAGLSDTLYVIFQCAGNTTGHLANWVDGCNPSTGNRTTTISFGAGCTQMVTYNRCSLTNQNGGIGGSTAERDGARVDFSPNGVATYANDGCTIPYTPLTIGANFISGQSSFCDNETVPVQAVVNGSGVNPIWSSADGTFSDPNSLLSFFTPSPSSSGAISLTFSIENGCGDLISTTISAALLAAPEVLVNVTITQDGCNQMAEITASGASTYTWSTGEQTASISVDVSGVYTVVASNTCGTDEAAVSVELSSEELSFTVSPDTIICPGGSALLSAYGDYTFSWSAHPFLSFTEEHLAFVSPTLPTVFTVVAIDENGCAGEQSVLVDVYDLPELAVSPDAFGFLEDEFELWAQADAEGTYYWSPTEFLSCTNCAITSSQPNQSMVYTVTFVDSNGCSIQKDVRVRLESTLFIPNAFTPDNDGWNDVFGVQGADLDEFELIVFNRWGELIVSLKSYDDVWDGTYKGRLSPEGVYPWVLRFRDNDGLQYERMGHVTLIRR
jgi:gliding motility-associated-like protein